MGGLAGGQAIDKGGLDHAAQFGREAVEGGADVPVIDTEQHLVLGALEPGVRAASRASVVAGEEASRLRRRETSRRIPMPQIQAATSPSRGLGGYLPRKNRYLEAMHEWEMWADSWTGLALLSQAAAAAITAVTAITAAFYAAAQVRHARALREEQTRPFVTVSFRPSHATVCNIIIRNEGKTLARNVRFRFDPEWESSQSERNKVRESKVWREGIPTLVPGQEITILADSFPQRYKRDDLPRTYAVEVSYEGLPGSSSRKSARRSPKFTLNYTLDFDIFYGYNQAQLYGVHELADAARQVRTILASWGEHGNRGPLSVVIRNGDNADIEEQREFEELRRVEHGSEVPLRRARDESRTPRPQAADDR